ncbi:MAG: tetraacyldisaccharide 4'-kinase [Agitococcus sp.]|nr:tetraacyldisaccharide 4'-kinase [Agitococcus sp.]
MSEKLVKAWYHGHWALMLLAPLAWLYRLITAVRGFCYRRGWFSVAVFPLPVIVVGNITVGGTGKTPLTLALVKHLQAQGFKPAIVSRGYGGQTQYPALVTATSQASEVGDEPLFMFQQTQVPVVVAPKRAQAVARLVQQNNCDVVLCDDGLQHYALARDMEIVVIDAERGLGNGQLLPQGPLRENKERLTTVDFIVINGKGSYHCPQSHFDMALEPDDWLMVANTNQGIAPKPPQKVHAVAGIGNPARFFAALEQQGFQVIAHAFPDHHAFQLSDLTFGDDLPIVMTAKDAVKCVSFPLTNVWQVPVVATLSDSFYEQFDQKLAAVRQRKNLITSLIE